MRSVAFGFLFFVCFFCFNSDVWAFGETELPPDSVVKVSGFVYDSISGDPLSNAVITYEQLPYGSLIGIVKPASGTGYFEFYTRGQSGYRITVRAEGYGIIMENINPMTEAPAGSMSRKYYLSPVPQEGEVINLNHLIFAQGKSDITEVSYSELNDLVKMLKGNPSMVIQLEGHTDFRGSRTENMKLSEDRVVAVKTYLMRKGIDSDRILTKAYGGTRPVTREASEEAAKLNRRVEVRIIRK